MDLNDMLKSGADSLLNGGSGGSNLKGFLSKFNSSEGNFIDTIDPLNTFDVSIAFFPRIEPPKENDSRGWGDILGDAANSVMNGIAGSVKNTLNNVTGGLVGSLMNSVNIMDLKDKFVHDGNFGYTTVLDYIARGNLLVTDDSWTSLDGWFGGASGSSMSPQLIIGISYYVQNITLPQMTLADGGQVNTALGQFPVNGQFVRPNQNSFTMSIINTKAPIMERIFYPWMREITLPYWSYEEQPYTTATITIDFSKHSDLKYVFVGCRPSNIETIQPTNELGIPTRNVTMLFDHMFINSNLKTNEGIGTKLLNLGKSAVSDLESQFGL